MAINSVTDLRNTDAGQTAFTVRQNPVGGSTPCHAMQVTQAATAGDGGGVSVVSNNSSSPAIRVRGAGPFLQLYDASNTLKFEISNTGALGAITMTSLTTTGNVSVGGNASVTGTLAVTSTSTLTGNVTMSGNASVTGTLAVTSTSTLTGNVTMTNNATVGGTFGVTGATTLDGALVVDDANFSVLGTDKGYRFRPLGSRLDCEATGSDWMFSVFSGTNFDGTQRTYLRLESGVTLAHACGTWTFTDTADSAAVHTLDGTGNKLGFHGATSVAQQTIAGSRGGNAALADLLTKLALTGLIVDGTSA